MMETLTVEEALKNFLQLMEHARDDNSQFRITAESGNVVLLSEETYQNLMVTLELLSTPGLMSGIKLLNTNEAHRDH